MVQITSNDGRAVGRAVGPIAVIRKLRVDVFEAQAFDQVPSVRRDVAEAYTSPCHWYRASDPYASRWQRRRRSAKGMCRAVALSNTQLINGPALRGDQIRPAGPTLRSVPLGSCTRHRDRLLSLVPSREQVIWLARYLDEGERNIGRAGTIGSPTGYGCPMDVPRGTVLRRSSPDA